MLSTPLLLPPTSFQSLSCVSSCPSALYSSHLAATPSPLCSRSHFAPLAVTASVVRDSPPRAFSFKILSRRRGPEGVQHLHSTLPHRQTDRPTDRPRKAPHFRPPRCAPFPALAARFSYRATQESIASRNARVLPLLVLKRIFILCARAPMEAAVAARLPSRLAAAAGQLVLVVISIGRRSGRGERRQCAATPISQSVA